MATEQVGVQFSQCRAAIDPKKSSTRKERLTFTGRNKFGRGCATSLDGKLTTVFGFLLFYTYTFFLVFPRRDFPQ